MFSLICVRMNGWVNDREAGDLRHHRTHYDVTVMKYVSSVQFTLTTAICSILLLWTSMLNSIYPRYHPVLRSMLKYEQTRWYTVGVHIIESKHLHLNSCSSESAFEFVFFCTASFSFNWQWIGGMSYKGVLPVWYAKYYSYNLAIKPKFSILSPDTGILVYTDKQIR